MRPRNKLKTELLRLIGEFPVKVPLSPSTSERVDCGSYVREKIEYSSEDNDRIPAYLLIPKNLSGKAPAIFCHHQHNGEFDLGKSEVVGLAGNPEQAYAHELAERGYVCLAPDAIAFEERNWGHGGQAEYWELATRLVQGRTLMAKALHDVAVGIDYLCSRSDVDVDRIGFIGHSYGGRMAIWAPAFDERIKASVSHCGCVNYKNSLFHEVGIQMEFCIPGIMEVAEVEDVATLIEPRALLLSATDDDVWSREAKEFYEYAKPAFAKGKIELAFYEAKHVFTPAMRERAYRFLAENL